MQIAQLKSKLATLQAENEQLSSNASVLNQRITGLMQKLSEAEVTLKQAELDTQTKAKL